MYEKTTEEASSKFKTVGEIPCLLVFSDRKHVPYIYNIVNCLEEILPSLGFAVKKLSDESSPDTHFGENIENLVEECILGIVIFDGFRPNVLFEYGLLRGKGKLVIPLQDKRATIAIKSLYSINKDDDRNDIRRKTNLTKNQFERLSEPPIGFFSEFSDRHGINLILIDCHATLESEEHPKEKIKTEIKKMMPKILEKYSNQTFRTLENTMPHYLEEFQQITLEILQLYTRLNHFETQDLKAILLKINELESKTKTRLPSSIYNIIASLYTRLARGEN